FHRGRSAGRQTEGDDMPMECVKCSYQDVASTDCPKCGSRMRYTLLNAASEDDKVGKQSAIVEGTKPPGFFQRSVQLFGCWFLSTLLTILVGGFGLVAIRAVDPAFSLNTGSQTHPAIFASLMFGAPILGVLMGTTVSLGSVFLSQLVGMAAGVATALTFLGARTVAERYGMQGVTPGILEWSTLPFFTAAFGFFAGLWVRGKIDAPKEVEFTPIDGWDHDAKPTFVEKPPSPADKLAQLGKSVAAVPFLYFFCVIQPLYFFASGEAGAIRHLDKSRWALNVAMVLAAGGLAAAGTKSGFSQGLFAGLIVWGQSFIVTTFKIIPKDPLMEGVIFCVLGAFGGVIGRYSLRPWRTYRHNLDERRDGKVPYMPAPPPENAESPPR
ncbi:MAG: hypothetical protein ACRDD1_18705, partial [Planctomycetia bacterium]